MSLENEVVTVVNRTSKPLQATWNGRPYDIPPYPARIALPKIVALAARFQNPIMGVGSPAEDWSRKSEYLVGIVEDKDPIDPIEQTDEVQRWDFRALNGSNFIIERPRGGGYKTEVRQPQKANMQDTAFDKP